MGLRKRTDSAHAFHQTLGGCANDKVNSIIWEVVKEPVRRPKEGEAAAEKCRRHERWQGLEMALPLFWLLTCASCPTPF